jgi:protein SCO1/2
VKRIGTYCGASGARSRFARAIVVVFAFAAMPAFAQIAPPPFEPLNIMGPDPTEQFKDIKIEQHLDAQVPIELTFVKSNGEPISIAEALDGKPAILALVYYECPMLCNVMLDGVEGVVDAMKYEIGEDYNVITVSIDPGETPELAAAKKAAHLERLHRDGAEDGWYFLTGDETAIERLAGTVGFRYAYDPSTDQYAHAGGIMVLTGAGRIARYYYGTEYIPRDVEFGLQEASAGRVGSVVDQLVLLCFKYDPATGKYGFYILGAMRIMAGMMILGFVTMYTVLYVRWRRAKRAAGGGDPGMSDPSARPQGTH